MQPLRLKLGLVLVSFLAFVFFYPSNLIAARHGASKSAVTHRSGKELKEQGRTKAAAKSTAKGKAKSATHESAKGSAKSHSSKSAGAARSAKGSAKGSSKGSLKRSPKGSQRDEPEARTSKRSSKGSSRTASRRGSKRSQPTVYRQQQPDPERIREIQQALNDHGYPLEVSGAWDAATVDALRKFQTDQNIENLSGKGKLDSLTLIALGLGPKREPPSGLAEPPKQTPEGKVP